MIDQGGTVETVSYNLVSPQKAKLVDIPFHINSAADSDEGGIYGVLKQLQGARVRVQTGPQSFEGAVLNVTRQTVPVNDEKILPMTVEMLIISGTDGTLRSFKLNDILSVTCKAAIEKHMYPERTSMSAVLMDLRVQPACQGVLHYLSHTLLLFVTVGIPNTWQELLDGFNEYRGYLTCC